MKKTSTLPRTRIPKKRNPVKRFFVNLFVLCLFGAVVFYFGWVQFELKEGEYGVFFSKTGGYEEEVLVPGEFNWRWEQIIPTNATLHIVRLQPATIKISRKGIFPSANLYASFINENEQIFSWNYSGRLNYSLDPDYLPTLVKQGYAKNPDLWEEETKTIITEKLTSLLAQQSYIDDLLKQIPDTGSLISELSRNFPYLTKIGFTIDSLNYPDINLYNETASLYAERMRRLKEAETEILTKKLIETAEQNSKLELLARYGEILGDNPILLDFLTLETPDGTDPGIINSLLPGISTSRE